MLKILLLSLIIQIQIFAVDKPSDKKTKQQILIEKYVEKYDSKNISCNLDKKVISLCPKATKDNFARIHNINLQNGQIECLYYSKNNINIHKLHYSYTNFNCIKEFENKKIKQNTKQYYTNTETIERVKVFQDEINKISDYYINIHTNNSKNDYSREVYVNGIKLLVAGVTLDNDIIDIKKSLQLGYVVLQQGYTFNTNEVIERNTPFSLSNAIDTLKNILNNIFGEKVREDIIDKDDNKEINTRSNLLSNAIIFYFGIMTGINDIYQEAIAIIILLGLLINGISMYFLRNDNRQENSTKKLLIAGVLLYLFVGSITIIPSENKKEIHQSTLQDYGNYIYYETISLADKIALQITKYYHLYLGRELGIRSKNEIEFLEKELEKELIILSKNEKIESICKENFDFKKVKELTKTINTNITTVFPPTVTPQNRNGQNLSYYNLLDEKNKTKHNTPTHTICYKAIYEQTQNKNNITNINNKLKQIETVFKDTQNNIGINNLRYIASIQYKAIIEQGFIAIGLVPLSNLILNSTKQIKDDTENILSQQKDNFSNVNKNSPSSNIIKGLDFLPIEYLAYVSMPMFGDIYKFLQDNFENVSTSLKLLPSKIITSTIKEVAIFATAIWIYETILDTIPYLTISLIFTILITYYILQILIVYIITPFFAMYLLASSQQEKLVIFFKNLVLIGFKPIILVITTTLSILSMIILTNIAKTVIGTPMIMLKNLDKGIWLKDISTNIQLIIIEKMAYLLVDIVAFILSALLMLYGDKIIYSKFGIREDGRIEDETRNAENKIHKGLEQI